MVSVTSSGRLLLTDLDEELVRTISVGASERPLEAAFAAWALGAPNEYEASLASITGTARQHHGGQRSYTDVATLGFAAAGGDHHPETLAALEAGLTWITGRQALREGRPAEFVQDPVALLGVVLGTTVLQKEILSYSVKRWYEDFAAEAFAAARGAAWQQLLLTAAAQVLGATPVIGNRASPDASDVCVALRARGLLGVLTPDRHREEEASALATLRTTPVASVSHATLRLAALRWLRRTAPIVLPEHAGVAELIALLRGMPRAFERWTWEGTRPRTRNGIARCWHVDHEYHVQNLLWFLLAPVFPDLRAEESLPPVGHRQPRADLGIPSLGVVVEVKFAHGRTSFSDFTEEIASDVSLYLTAASPYRQIVVFVWDESRRTEQYERLNAGLLAMRGVTGVVIVARPGAMVDSPDSDAAKP